MKHLAVNSELCLACGKCEEVCSTAFFKEHNKEKSSIRIYVKEDDTKEINVCSQCGACIDVCPVQAISRDKNGVIRVDKKACVGCLSCVGFCPSMSMRFHEDQPEVFKCTACGLCAKQCPTEAITIENN